MTHPGYISSRPIDGSRTPQHIQNLVIRDHARRHGLTYALSITELAMPNCYFALRQLCEDILDGAHQGFIAYSLWMLPQDPVMRREIYLTCINANATLHTAVENMVLATEADIEAWEDLWRVKMIARSFGFEEMLRDG